MCLQGPHHDIQACAVRTRDHLALPANRLDQGNLLGRDREKNHHASHTVARLTSQIAWCEDFTTTLALSGSFTLSARQLVQGQLGFTSDASFKVVSQCKVPHMLGTHGGVTDRTHRTEVGEGDTSSENSRNDMTTVEAVSSDFGITHVTGCLEFGVGRIPTSSSNCSRDGRHTLRWFLDHLKVHMATYYGLTGDTELEMVLQDVPIRSVVVKQDDNSLGGIALGAGQVIIGSSLGMPVAASITGAGNVTVTPGSGSISVDTVPSPTFAHVTDTSLTPDSILACDAESRLQAWTSNTGMTLTKVWFVDTVGCSPKPWVLWILLSLPAW